MCGSSIIIHSSTDDVSLLQPRVVTINTILATDREPSSSSSSRFNWTLPSQSQLRVHVYDVRDSAGWSGLVDHFPPHSVSGQRKGKGRKRLFSACICPSVRPSYYNTRLRRRMRRNESSTFPNLRTKVPPQVPRLSSSRCVPWPLMGPRRRLDGWRRAGINVSGKRVEVNRRENN